MAAEDATGGSVESCNKSSTMQDIVAEVQSLAEQSNIINRTPHLDLNWYLKFSPGEPEIRLVRTVQQVLACRYQPAQLSVRAMAAQLEEAEEYRRLVQEQVAVMKSAGATEASGANDSKSAEGQWTAALLDASATVQVKVAQLDQVRQYHRLLKMTRAFLEVLAAEKEKANLNALGSSALQAKQLGALLQTMEQKKHVMEELLLLSSQLSVHLSDAESSGALLAQLGDVQEEWRLLEGSIKRALRHASNSTCQSSLLLKESQLLKAKLEALQISNCENLDSKNVLEIVCLTTDLKLYNQLYLHLQSQSDSLISFSLGQKEKDEIRRSLQGLEAFLSVTKNKVDSLTFDCGVNLSTKLNKQLQDLIIWAKQAENHISVGERLALFPEEARIQIAEMKKFQTDVLSRRSKMQAQFEQLASDMEKEERDKVFKTIVDLYDAIAGGLDHILDTMKKNLTEREKLLCELAGMDAWLAETHAERDPCNHVENVSNADIRKLESELKSHRIATAKLESSLKLVESLSDACEKTSTGLSPGESRYLVNRVSGLWTELDGLLAHEKATCWELEELLHERTSSDQELSSIQASLRQISADLEQQTFPLTEATHSVIAHFKHMLMEHQCEAQELKHCQQTKRDSLLCSIGELQDRCKSLSANTVEQQKYLHLRRQMTESRGIAEKHVQRAKDKAVSVGERFKVCQALLVELPLIKTQCQEAADQLEAIAPELQPSDLQTEKEKIHSTVETLVSWERSATEDVRNLETELLLDLRFNSELPAFKGFLENTRAQLEEAKPVSPSEKAVDIALQQCWVIWRNLESGMRVLEGLGCKENIDMKEHKQLYALRDAVTHECLSQMDSLSLARESLKDYQWAAQGAIAFLHNAEATFLSAPGGFLDCTEEQQQTQQALEALEDGFQAHILHLMERVPQQRCLSASETDQLHIDVLSQLLVGRAVLEAQAHLRLESLKRCEMREQTHRKCHEEVRQHLCGIEARLTDCAGQQVTSYEKCIAQQRQAQLLMEDVDGLAVKIEELRAGCPMQGCGVGKDGELGALWRRRMSLRRGVGLLMAHTEQRGEEWKDITASMEQCCSFLASLQADVPDSSAVSFSQDEPQELLAQAEMHQAGLEQEQQALASLEHRLEHALSLSASQEPASPGPVGKTLVKIQENVRSLKERNLLVVAAAQAEERERQHVQEEIGKVEKHVLTILHSLDECSSPSKRQALRRDLLSQRTKLKSIADGLQSRYAEIPADIGRTMQDVHLSLQQTEEKLMESNSTARKLSSRVKELDSGLEKVKALLEKGSPTLTEAQNVLKCVWDELDSWHSSLMLLESEVQDLAGEQPDQAQLLIDQLTQPLQLYQNAAQMAEQRTAFLNRIPACLQEYEDLLFRASCWLDEAQSWLGSPCSFTTARSMQNHAKSLQLVMDDSERLRRNLQDFGSVLEEISCVCDMRAQKKRLDHNEQQVQKMQSSILEPLEQLLHAVGMVEAMEAEIKPVEKNIPKIRTILSSMDISYIPLTEHLHNRQVILANVQSMRKTLEAIERSKLEFFMPKGAEQSLLVFSRCRQLLQPLEELEQLAQQQAAQLETKIREEGETNQDPGRTSGSNAAGEMQQLCGSLHRRLVQEAFERSNSEEEEDEEDERHSSSSDTLTCSIPEDLEETFNSEDMAEINTVSDVQELEHPERTNQFSSLVEKSSKVTEAKVSPVKPEFSISFGSESAEKELKADADKAFIPRAEPLNGSAGPAVQQQVKSAEADRLDSPKHEACDAGARTESFGTAAVVEDTRLIPSRPVNPFSAEAASEEEEEEEDVSPSTAPHPDVCLRQQSEVCSDPSSLTDKSQQPLVFSEAPSSFASHKHDDEEFQRWSQLHSQITEKLNTLKKVSTEHQTEDGGDGVKAAEKSSPETSSSVLQQTDESISRLREIVKQADGSHAGVKAELYEAVRSVLLSLDSLTNFALTPADEDKPQMRRLQQECVSADLATLAELMSKVESKTRSALSEEDTDARSCFAGLQDCLHTVQLVLTSSRDQLSQQPEVNNEQKELSPDQMCLLEELELGQNEVFPGLKDVLSLECVLGRHLRQSPGEKAQLQHASRSLLQGIARLLALGEECIRERQTSPVHSCSKLQVVLCRDKKLLQVLRSQLAFVRHLFQHEPEALGRQEDQRVQLEVGAEALLQQALEHDVASQRTLQEWTRWEDSRGQLGRVLDESEAFISSGEPEGDDDEESVQRRLDACQQTLAQLDESRATLGLLLDQGKLLQAQPGFSGPVGQTGGALELRWRSAHKRTQQEIQRCRDIQESRARFQTDFSSVSEWLPAAVQRLETLSGRTGSSQPSLECVRRRLIQLLDFSTDVEAMSALRASALKNATQLLHLREADCPELRARLSQQETSWNQLASDLLKTQEQLQQHLLAEQLPAELLSDLEEWLKEAQTRLNQEKESVLKAENAAQINEILQHYQALKAAIANGQLLLDFLSQPGPQMMGKDVQDRRSERTAFAEKLGTCRLHWLNLQGELQSQIRETEEMHEICVKRERRLPRLHGWLKQQRKQLDELKQPTSQTLAHKSLQEWEDVEGRVGEVAAALLELKGRRAQAEKNKEHPCDVAFSEQAEAVCQDCEDLSRQMAALRPALQQTLEDWHDFHEKLRDVALDTTRGRCALQHQRAPLLSLKQAEEYSVFLQQLQEKIKRREEAWRAVEESSQCVGKRLHHTAAQRLRDQVEEEQSQWKDLMQELKDEHMNAEKMLPLWQQYVGLSESCSVQLQQLWHQWEELPRSSPTPEQELSSVKKLQDAAEELQSSMGDVLEASKHLIGRLEPPAVNLVVSETRLLSRDVLLLNKAMSGRLKRLQEDSEQHEIFLTQLEVLEKETQSLQQTLEVGVHDAHSVEQVFSELSSLFPSLVDIRETSTCTTLNEGETDRLRTLSREWIRGVARTCDVIRELQAEHQHSQSFQEKSENLKSIQEKLEGESECDKSTSYSGLQERMATHQRLQAEVVVGHQLLQGLQRDAVQSLEKEAGEERFELLEQVARMKESWRDCLASTERNWVSIKEQLHQWKLYRQGSKRLQKLLTEMDSVLPPTGISVFTLHQLLGSLNDYQHVNESLDLLYPVYAQTLEAGKHLCETLTESDCQSGLQSELQAMTEAWERASLLRRRRDHVNATVQMWTSCQDGIDNTVSELKELELKKPDDSQDEAYIQETELSLQRLSGGLRELATMKTDLSQYVAASDSALLEQQLEQLHGQWEELCMKVSLRRQEIADRLNAWTIFNDKNKEFCDWLTQMENKVCHSGDLSIEEMVEKLKKDCMEEINLFSENKSHLKHLGEQLLLASDEAKQTQVRGSLHEVNQHWHSLFCHIEARVKKLKETLVTVQQLDKNMSNLRSWLSRIEAELSRPVTYSVCHEQEIQKRLAEQLELQRDIEQHTEGVASVLNLCDVLLRDEDAAGGGSEVESDSLQETSRSLDQRWRTICAMALDRRLRIEETWTLWCKFLNDYSRFEDWLKMAERTAANPNSADVLFTVAKEELKKFEGFQRQVHERLTQLELVNNQYRRLARENRTDRASQLRAMVHEGNRRWDALHRRVAAILRRLKHFTGQREEFEGLRESMLVWLTELDLQLTNVEHFSESDVHQKIQQLNSFQKEITLNTERIDGLIVFGEGLIQKSSPQDAALIEDELEELHSYCQEVFSRLVRFHQRLSQPTTIKEEPELSGTSFSLESSLELIGRPLLGRSLGSLPATPTHLLASPLERSGRETPMSVESLPLEWDHTGDVGGSSSHEDDEEEEEEHEEEGAYFSALSEVTARQEEFVEASDAPQASSSSSLVPSRSMAVHEPPRWRPSGETGGDPDASPTLTSTPLKPGYLRLMSQCSGSIENIKRLSLMLDDEEPPEEFGLTGLTASDKQSGVIERWELLQAQSRRVQPDSPQEPPQLQAQLHDVTSWLESVTPELDRLQRSEPAASIQDMEARAKELKEMQKMFARYKSIMLSVNLRAEEAPELQERLTGVNRGWSRACTRLQQWDTGLRKTLLRCQEFHETLHSLLLWLAHAESRRYAVDISHPDTSARALQQHRNTLTELQDELRSRQTQQASLQALWSQLQPADGAEESDEAQEKLHVTGNKLKLLLRQVDQDLSSLQQRLDSASAVQNAPADPSQEAELSQTTSSPQRERRESSPPRSFFYRVLRAAFPLHLFLLLLLLLPCLIPMSEGDASCTVTNNFARSFYPMLHYTNGPPPT
ncbi:nesprin-2-like isoform X2 [Salarias fasciatus]|uniref:nesprin-2-like isoform X2 n=1 Tax=Salarias fasciatus TaxID=181472 RepID=UPI001176A42C|nr:nesprin-2-like isoform X2 [Salarias fasciatus]